MFIRLPGHKRRLGSYFLLFPPYVYLFFVFALVFFVFLFWDSDPHCKPVWQQQVALTSAGLAVGAQLSSVFTNVRRILFGMSTWSPKPALMTTRQKHLPLGREMGYMVSKHHPLNTKQVIWWLTDCSSACSRPDATHLLLFISGWSAHYTMIWL